MVVGWVSTGAVVQRFLYPLRTLQVVVTLAVLTALLFAWVLAEAVFDLLEAGATFFATAGVIFFLAATGVDFFLVLDLLSAFFFLRSLLFTGSDFCAVGVLACPVACANGVKDNDVNSNAQSVNDHFFICATEQPSEYAG